MKLKFKCQKKVKSQTQSPQKRPSLAHHCWIDFSLDLHTFLLNFYFASKLNQLVISPLIDQEFPFLIRRGRRREHYTLLSPNFNPKLCRSSKGPFIFCDTSSFFFSYHLLVIFSSACDICHQLDDCDANMAPIIFCHFLQSLRAMLFLQAIWLLQLRS